jgi:FkbM family methyltransferase
MSTLLDRLLNASARSVGRRIKRRLGFAVAPPAGTLRPVWERIADGPLAGREVLIDRRGSAAWEDVIAGRFDAEIYAALSRVLPPGAVLWDVGAHMGFHTLAFAAIAGPAGRVVSFEPNPANRERLLRTLEKNADLAGRVEILSCALSDRDGESSFVVSDDLESGASSMSFLDGTTPAVNPLYASSWARIVVPLRTIDGLIRDRDAPPPDAMKIDVEGAELLVLRGAIETMRSVRPMVIVEAHSASLVFELQRWFAAQGYEVELLAALAPSRALLCGTARASDPMLS